jgi:transposase
VSAGSLIGRAGPEILVHVPTPSDKQPSVPAGGSDPAPRPTRRVFTPAYKLAMVAEYENAPNGDKGAILRREGLYSSHIVEWTRARDSGVLSGDPAASAKRAKKSAELIELEKLRRQNEKLESDLTKTRLALSIMGKAHALLEELSESADNDRPPRTS